MAEELAWFVCNHCRRPVQFDTTLPPHRCDDPDHDCGMGRWVHICDPDCHSLTWAIQIPVMTNA